MAKKKRRFVVNESQIVKDLKRTFGRMGTEQCGKELSLMNEGARVVFVLKGKDGMLREYQYECDSFDHQLDNLRACEQAVTLMYRVYETYKVRPTNQVASMEAIFQGFRIAGDQAKYLGDGKDRPAHEVLEISPHASADEINHAYKVKARTNHPDRGGDAEEFKRICKAKDHMLEVLS